jgi:hypothetical protein
MTLPEGVEYSLTESALFPFLAEPTQFDDKDAYFREVLLWINNP